MTPAIQLRDEPTSPLITVYCVQLYWRDRDRLARGPVKQYRRELDARKGGSKLRPRDAGSVVFAMRGNPMADFWEEPRILATFGDVPGAKP